MTAPAAQILLGQTQALRIARSGLQLNVNLLPGAFRKAGDVATLIEGAVPGWRRDRALEPRRRRDAEKAVAGLKVGCLGTMLTIFRDSCCRLQGGVSGAGRIKSKLLSTCTTLRGLGVLLWGQKCKCGCLKVCSLAWHWNSQTRLRRAVEKAAAGLNMGCLGQL